MSGCDTLHDTVRDVLYRGKKSMTHEELLARKAKQSRCHYRVAAIGFDRNRDIVSVKVNRPRFCKEGGSLHAEMAVMRQPRNVKTIVIGRIGQGGELRPIHPCGACQKLADKLGIKIESVK